MNLYSIYFEEFGYSKVELVASDIHPSPEEAQQYLKTEFGFSVNLSSIEVTEAWSATLDGVEVSIIATPKTAGNDEQDQNRERLQTELTPRIDELAMALIHLDEVGGGSRIRELMESRMRELEAQLAA